MKAQWYKVLKNQTELHVLSLEITHNYTHGVVKCQKQGGSGDTSCSVVPVFSRMKVPKSHTCKETSETILPLVSSPDLIRCVYHFQYNAWENNTESDPHWGWFWVWDQDYSTTTRRTHSLVLTASVANHPGRTSTFSGAKVWQEKWFSNKRNR